MAGIRGASTSLSTLRRLWSLLAPLVGRLPVWLVVVATLGLANLAATVYLPLVTRGLIDALQVGDRGSFGTKTLSLVAVVVVEMVTAVSYRFAGARLAEDVQSGLRRNMVHAILRKRLRFFSQVEIGDLISRTANDTAGLKAFFTAVVLQLVLDTVMVASVAVILLRMHFELALITIACAPVSLIVGSLFSGAIARRSHETRERTAEVIAQMPTWLSRPVGLKALLLEPIVRAAFDERDRRLRDTAVRLHLIEMLASSSAITILLIPSIAVFALGGSMIFSGQLTIGALVAITTYAAFFHTPMQRSVDTLMVVLPGMTAVHCRLQEVIEADAEEELGPVPKVGPLATLSLDEPRLDLSGRGHLVKVTQLRARRGEMVGIVGPNGCGKSTLLNHLLRLGLDGRGRAWVHTEGGEAVPLHRGLCSTLPQVQLLLEGSLRDNIVAFEASADRTRLEQICEALGMRWVHALPQGLDTVLDASTLGRLSGGHLQQVGLASAIYRRAPIMILDEPGTSLDVQALESAVQVIRARKDCITLVVSHRDEVLRNCDRIYEFVPHPQPSDGCFEVRERS